MFDSISLRYQPLEFSLCAVFLSDYVQIERLHVLTYVLDHWYLQVGVTMCEQQILFSWLTALPVSGGLTSCR